MYENKKAPSYMISTHCDRYGRTTEDLMQLFVKQKPACFFIILKFFLEAQLADHKRSAWCVQPLATGESARDKANAVLLGLQAGLLNHQPDL